MKRFIGLLTILLVTGIAQGQDSLGIFYQGHLEGEKALAFTGDLMVTQEWVDYEDLGGYNFVVIKDNADPLRPQELWRGSPVFYRVGDMSFNGPGFIPDVILRDSLIISLQARYNTTDVRPWFNLEAAIEVVDWQHNQLLARFEWNGEPEVEWLLPGGIEVIDHYLVAGLGSFGTHVFDISDPSNIVEVFQSGMMMGSLTVIGDYMLYHNYFYDNEIISLYVTSASLAPEANEIRNLDSLLLSEWPMGERLPFGSMGLDYTYQNYIYFGGWKTLRLSDGGTIDSIGACDFIHGRFRISEGLLYSQAGNVLQVSDFSNPISPRLLETHTDSTELARMPFMVNDGYVYRMRGDPNEIYYLSQEKRGMHLFHRGALGAFQEANDPNRFILHSAYPNPFNSTTMIHFELPVSGTIRMTVTDLAGRNWLTESESGTTGENFIRLNGANLPSGAYIIKIKAGFNSGSIPISLIK